MSKYVDKFFLTNIMVDCKIIKKFGGEKNKK